MNLKRVIEELKKTERPIKIMEVCGTHTSSIYKNGLKSLLSPAIRLVSGPGCPVCVTPPSVIDGLSDYAFGENCTVLSFGDMMRVPGSSRSMSEAKTAGGSVRLMYSPFDAVSLAEENPNRLFILSAVGFETTAPVYAALLDTLIRRGIRNVKLYTALKTMPEILDYICANESIDAFLCPGHVSAVIGSGAYTGLWEKFGKPFVIAGFEAEHILAAVYEILRQSENGEPRVRNLYQSVVTENGQQQAQGFIHKYFVKTDAFWRGIGTVKGSGYELKPEFSEYSANLPNALDDPESLNPNCRCSDIILGRAVPDECPLFQTVCTPQRPAGACMVSPEGSCGIWASNAENIKRSGL